MIIRVILFFMLCAAIFISFYYFIWNYLTRRQIQKRLFSVSALNTSNNEKYKSNQAKALLTHIKNLSTRIVPLKTKENLKMIVRSSGSSYTVEDIILIKLLLALIVLVLDCFLFIKLNHSLNNIMLLILLSITIFNSPEFILKRKLKGRQKNIRRMLPTFIDYLTISVEAGLGLDTAIFHVLKHIHGALADEIAYAMTEIQYGKSKKDAFKNLSDRINIPELTIFITALISSDQLGLSLGSTLRVQGQQIRQKRKQQVQEAAYKISIKLLFPLVLFILPSLFIVLLGPAVISMYRTLIK